MTHLEFVRALNLYLMLFRTKNDPMKIKEQLRSVSGKLEPKIFRREFCPDFDGMVNYTHSLVKTGLFAAGKGRKLYQYLVSKIEKTAPQVFRQGLEEFYKVKAEEKISDILGRIQFLEKLQGDPEKVREFQAGILLVIQEMECTGDVSQTGSLIELMKKQREFLDQMTPGCKEESIRKAHHGKRED